MSSGARRRSGAAAPCSLLYVLCVEVASAAVALVFGIWYADLFRNMESFRGRVNIAILAYCWITFAGYLLSIPPLCLAIHRGSPGLLVPFLIWRLLLTLGSIALGVVLGLLLQDQDNLLKYPNIGLFNYPVNIGDSLKWWIPPIVLQCAHGLFFLIIVFLAFTRMSAGQRRATLGVTTAGRPAQPYPYADGAAGGYPYAAYGYSTSDGGALGTSARPDRRPDRRASQPKRTRRASTVASEAQQPVPLQHYAYSPQLYYGYYNYATPNWRY